MNKKEQVSALLESGKIHKACSVARKFFFGLTKDEKRSIEITADCSSESRAAFYTSLGVDVSHHVAAANKILLSKYGQSSSTPSGAASSVSDSI